jgi:hypothetical protein
LRSLNLARRYAVLRVHLDERQRGLLLGTGAGELGRGGVKTVAEATGAHPETVARGVREVEGRAEPQGRVRAKTADDALNLVFSKGMDHESAYLQRLRQASLVVTGVHGEEETTSAQSSCCAHEAVRQVQLLPGDRVTAGYCDWIHVAGFVVEVHNVDLPPSEGRRVSLVITGRHCRAQGGQRRALGGARCRGRGAGRERTASTSGSPSPAGSPVEPLPVVLAEAFTQIFDRIA